MSPRRDATGVYVALAVKFTDLRNLFCGTIPVRASSFFRRTVSREESAPPYSRTWASFPMPRSCSTLKRARRARPGVCVGGRQIRRHGVKQRRHAQSLPRTAEHHGRDKPGTHKPRHGGYDFLPRIVSPSSQRSAMPSSNSAAASVRRSRAPPSSRTAQSRSPFGNHRVERQEIAAQQRGSSAKTPQRGCPRGRAY